MVGGAPLVSSFFNLFLLIKVSMLLLWGKSRGQCERGIVDCRTKRGMNSFDESKVRRSTDCKFANKPHAEAEVDLNDIPYDRWEQVEDARTTADLGRIEYYLRSDMLGVPETAVRNPSLSADDLAFIIDHYPARVRVGAAYNPNLSDESRKALMDDPNTSLAVAISPLTPPEDLAGLATHRHSVVRAGVAFNESTPVEVLETLALDESDEVRSAAVANSNTPDISLSQNVGSEYLAISKGIAGNPNASPQTLTSLWGQARSWRDADGALTDEAFSLRIDDDLENDTRSVVRQIASNKNTPTEVLSEIAKTRFPPVGALAGNPNTPTEALSVLVRDHGYDLDVAKMATSPNVTPGILDALSRSKIEQVRVAAAKNPSTPVNRLRALGRSTDMGVARAAGRTLRELKGGNKG